LSAVSAVLSGTKVSLGAQDVSSEEAGAHTGEVIASLLHEVGCRYVIVGHSERRRRLGESNDLIKKKVAAAVRHNLTPILCVGETHEERSAGRSEEVVREQVATAVGGLNLAEGALVVAYEPVWAISPNPPARAVDALSMRPIIEDVLARELGQAALRDQCVLVYGGSVRPENVLQFVGPETMQGVLVGAESLVAGEFLKIIDTVSGQNQRSPS
jgi:triosephosphate isomerase